MYFMTDKIVIVKGIIRNVYMQKSGNMAYIIEDGMQNIHHCFSPSKDTIAAVSDEIIILGSIFSSNNKIRINYYFNKSKDSEETLIFLKSERLFLILVSLSIIVSIFCISSLIIILSSSNFTDDLFILLILFEFITPILIPWGFSLLLYYSSKEKRELLNQINIKKKDLRKESIELPLITQINESSLQEKIKYCKYCGEKLDFQVNFCPFCGKTLN